MEQIASLAVPSAEIPTAEEVLAGLRECLATAVEPDDLARIDLASLQHDTPLLSLPLDSLALMAMMTSIEDRFRVYIPEDRAFAFTTIGEVVDHVTARIAAKTARQQG